MFTVCCMCEGPEPFACPSRFRRSYMGLHLEKAHGLPVKELKFTRRAASGDRKLVWPAVWMTGTGDDSKQVLLETELDFPARPGMTEQAGSSQAPVSGSGRAPAGGATATSEASASPPASPASGRPASSPAPVPANASQQWTPAALQELYRRMEVKPA